MCEFESLDRCAAYVAARSALEAIHRASAAWPDELGDRARAAARETVTTLGESIAHDHGSPGRRRYVRAALGTALEVAAACDVARALGLADAPLEEALRSAGRVLALLALLFHASASPLPD